MSGAKENPHQQAEHASEVSWEVTSSERWRHKENRGHIDISQARSFLDPTPKQLWFEDLKIYRQHETWVTGFVLTGIALLTKELAAWKDQWYVPLIPIAIGFGAFFHLRIANQRSRRARWLLQQSEVPLRPGWYGRFMACWPILAGIVSSRLLCDGSGLSLISLFIFPIGICDLFFTIALFLSALIVLLLEPYAYNFHWKQWISQQEENKRNGARKIPIETFFEAYKIAKYKDPDFTLNPLKFYDELLEEEDQGWTICASPQELADFVVDKREKRKQSARV